MMMRFNSAIVLMCLTLASGNASGGSRETAATAGSFLSEVQAFGIPLAPTCDDDTIFASETSNDSTQPTVPRCRSLNSGATPTIANLTQCFQGLRQRLGGDSWPGNEEMIRRIKRLGRSEQEFLGYVLTAMGEAASLVRCGGDGEMIAVMKVLRNRTRSRATVDGGCNVFWTATAPWQFSMYNVYRNGSEDPALRFAFDAPTEVLREPANLSRMPEDEQRTARRRVMASRAFPAALRAYLAIKNPDTTFTPPDEFNRTYHYQLKNLDDVTSWSRPARINYNSDLRINGRRLYDQEAYRRSHPNAEDCGVGHVYYPRVDGPENAISCDPSRRGN